jgi:hypothetical protein
MAPRTLVQGPRTGFFEEKPEASPDSGTLRDYQSSNENVTGEEKPEAAESHSNNDGSTNDERPVDGGEKGKDTGPPKPAGFWDKSMNKVRLQVFGLWARTGQ